MNKIALLFFSFFLLTASTKSFCQSEMEIYSNSPLIHEAKKLKTNPIQTNYEIFLFLSGFKRNQIDMETFYKIKSETLELAFFARALTQATLMIEDDDLFEIINSYQKGKEKEVVLKFEAKFFDTYKRYPPLAPVDSDAITRRIINGGRLR